MADFYAIMSAQIQTLAEKFFHNFIIMKLNTDKVLTKISTLIDRLGKTDEFEEIHEEALNLCRIVYGRKADYKKIDIQYPEELIIKITDFSGNKNHQIIDGNPNRKTTISELKTNTLSILKKLKKYFQLKKDLEE